jgi:hypothetical protein
MNDPGCSPAIGIQSERNEELVTVTKQHRAGRKHLQFGLAVLVTASVWLAIAAATSNVRAQDLTIGSPAAAPTFEGEFTDVSDYWTIAWNDTWQVTSYSPVDFGEQLQLSDGIWTVRLQGPIFNPISDAGFVPGDARTAMIDLATALDVSSPLMSPNGRPLQHFSAARCWRVYVQENGEPIFLDVRKLDDSGAFLYIIAWAEGGAPAFSENYETMLLLLENVRLLR